MENGHANAHETLTNNGKRHFWCQHMAALSASLAAFSGGTVYGWSTPIVPYLQEKTRSISDEDASWLCSLNLIGASVGALFAGYIADSIGRKKTLVAIAAPYITSWIIFISVETNFFLLCLGRFISGLGLGSTLVVLPVYNEEISDLQARGVIGTYCEINICLGLLFSFVIGSYAPYIWYNIAACSIDVIFLFFFVWMPESPMFLLMKERYDDASKSLRWLRGTDEGNDAIIVEELTAMNAFIQNERAFKSANGLEGPLLIRLKNLVKDFSCGTPSMKAVVISFGLLMFQQLNGNNAMLSYTVIFFQDAGSSMSPYDSSIIVGSVLFAASCITPVIIDIAGRKCLVLFSAICSTICLSFIAIYLYFKSFGTDMSSVSWMPIVILNTFAATAEVGFGATPWLVMAEVSPPKTKGVITSTVTVFHWLVVFAVTKCYTDMVSSVGIAWTFGLYAIFSSIGIVFIVFVVPETKMKTREQIQQELKNGV